MVVTRGWFSVKRAHTLLQTWRGGGSDASTIHNKRVEGGDRHESTCVLGFPTEAGRQVASRGALTAAHGRQGFVDFAEHAVGGRRVIRDEWSHSETQE